MAKKRPNRLGRCLLVGPLTAAILAVVLVASTARLGSTDSDSDSDGLLDVHEVFGWSDERGRVWKTNPESADTDGDGLEDGFEAGPVLDGNAGKGPVYALWSSPLESDGDKDGLSDAAELVLDTKPQSEDSDDDGLSDGVEVTENFDPTLSNADGDAYGDAEELSRASDPFAYDLTFTQAAAAFAGGAVAGEFQWAADRLGLNAAQQQSREYLIGQFLTGLAGLADIRLTADQIASGDYANAVKTSMKIIPNAIGPTKALPLIRAFAARGPAAARAARTLVKRLKWSGSAKSILLSVVARGQDGRLVALTAGPANSSTYVARDEQGAAIFCGVTADVPRARAALAHRYDLFTIASSATRDEARAISQACSLQIRSEGGPTTLNQVNSIDPDAEEFDAAVAYGRERIAAAVAADAFRTTD